jgi:hypothetical protein
MSGTALEPDQTPTIVGPSPAAPAAPAPETPAAPEAPPAPVDDEADPPEAVTDASGRKLVPLDALKATRAELKAAKQLAQVAEQYRDAAEQGQQLGQFFQELNPLLAKLRNRPDIVANIMQAADAPQYGQPPGYPPAGYTQDPGEAILPKQDAEDLARTLELYTPEGLPDLQRARKIAFYMRRTGREEALGATAPLTQNLVEGQSGTLKHQYAQVRDKAGRTVNPAVLEQIWNIVPAELIAREPNVAGILYYAARGYSSHHGLDEPTAPARTPLFTEPAGGRPTAQGSPLNEFDRAMQKVTQITDKQYTERAARYKPGAINVLDTE